MRPTLLFFAGFVLAAGLARTAQAIACCYQQAENAPIALTALHIDGEPAEFPPELQDKDHNPTAGWDGIEITMLDAQGYYLGGESYTRRTP